MVALSQQWIIQLLKQRSTIIPTPPTIILTNDNTLNLVAWADLYNRMSEIIKKHMDLNADEQMANDKWVSHSTLTTYPILTYQPHSIHSNLSPYPNR